MPIQIEMSFGAAIGLVGLLGMLVSYTLYITLVNKELLNKLENYKQAVASKDARIKALDSAPISKMDTISTFVQSTVELNHFFQMTSSESLDPLVYTRVITGSAKTSDDVMKHVDITIKVRSTF